VPFDALAYKQDVEDCVRTCASVSGRGSGFGNFYPKEGQAAKGPEGGKEAAPAEGAQQEGTAPPNVRVYLCVCV
jgi:hypothetical protein